MQNELADFLGRLQDFSPALVFLLKSRLDEIHLSLVALSF